MSEGPPSYPDLPQQPDQPGGSGEPAPPGQPAPGQQPPPYGQPFGQPAPSGQEPAAQPPAYAPPPPAPEQPMYAAPPAYAQQAYGQPPPPSTPADPDRRPGTVVAAAIVTWVFSGLALLFGGFMALSISADRDTVAEELEQDENFQEVGWSVDDFIDALNVVSIVTVVLSLLAIGLAVLAFRRSNGGRIALVVLSTLTALLTLAGSIFCIPALWLIASIVTIVLLFTGGANAWYKRTPAQAAYPQPGDYGQWPQA